MSLKAKAILYGWLVGVATGVGLAIVITLLAMLLNAPYLSGLGVIAGIAGFVFGQMTHDKVRGW